MRERQALWAVECETLLSELSLEDRQELESMRQEDFKGLLRWRFERLTAGRPRIPRLSQSAAPVPPRTFLQAIITRFESA
jgi:hypothetical protein